MNLVLTWASHGPGTQLDLGLSWIEWLWFPQGAHLIQLTVVLFYASPGPSDSVHIWACMALVTLVLTGIIGTWIHYSTPGPHLDLVTLVLSLASPGPGVSRPHLNLTQNC